jgi:phospholipid transport system substrate-binding protein
VTTRRSVLTAGCALAIGALAPALPAAAASGPADFVRELGNRALGVIRSELPPTQKRAYFRQLLDEDFDVPGIARFVLGPRWRLASGRERREFSDLLEDYLLVVYNERFGRYGGERLRVTGGRADADGATVKSEIVRPRGGPPIAVDWRLRVRDGLYKIEDVMIDGVSMAASQRAEFAAAIERNGGHIDGLFAMMRRRIAGAGAASAAAAPADYGSSAPRR